MTDKSICVRCAEMIRMRFKDFKEEERICGVEAIGTNVMGSGATVEECSRFVEVPGETASAAKAMKDGMSNGLTWA